MTLLARPNSHAAASRVSAGSDTSAAPRRPQGFAALSPEARREIASKGGKSVPPENRSFSRDRTLASAAGIKGGVVRGVPAKGGRTTAGARALAIFAAEPWVSHVIVARVANAGGRYVRVAPWRGQDVGSRLVGIYTRDASADAIDDDVRASR